MVIGTWIAVTGNGKSLFWMTKYDLSFCKPLSLVDLRGKQWMNCNFEINLVFFRTLRSMKSYFIEVECFKLLNYVVMQIVATNEWPIQKEYNDLFCHEIWLHEYFYIVSL